MQNKEKAPLNKQLNKTAEYRVSREKITEKSRSDRGKLADSIAQEFLEAKGNRKTPEQRYATTIFKEITRKNTDKPRVIRQLKKSKDWRKILEELANILIDKDLGKGNEYDKILSILNEKGRGKYKKFFLNITKSI